MYTTHIEVRPLPALEETVDDAMYGAIRQHDPNDGWWWAVQAFRDRWECQENIAKLMEQRRMI